MLVSTKGRYALRTMVDLAIHGDGEPVKIKDIANRQGISGKYLEQIISILSGPALCAASGEIREDITWPDRLRTIQWVLF